MSHANENVNYVALHYIKNQNQKLYFMKILSKTKLCGWLVSLREVEINNDFFKICKMSWL